MAFCEQCDREIPDEDAREVGDVRVCPRCRTPLSGVSDASRSKDGSDEEEGPPKAPWHFKVLLVGTIGYLIYRLIWFINWLNHH